jgi:hypothetical protein
MCFYEEFESTSPFRHIFYCHVGDERSCPTSAGKHAIGSGGLWLSQRWTQIQKGKKEKETEAEEAQVFQRNDTAVQEKKSLGKLMGTLETRDWSEQRLRPSFESC